jgi:PAS domain S-box-containing protein
LASWIELVDETAVGLLEAAPDAFIAVDDGGRIVLANARTERLFGYDRHQLLGQPVELLVPEHARGVHTAHRARFGREPHERPMGSGMELWGRRRDGTEFPAEISLSVVPTARGTLVAAVIRDATERRQADAQFRALLEAAPDAMVCVGADGHIMLVNAQAERLFGYTRDELAGQLVELLVPDSARAVHPHHREGYFEHPAPRQMGAGSQLTCRRKDGSEFPADISLSALQTDDGLLVSAAIRDVTERLAAQVEAESLRMEADRQRYERAQHQSQRLESLGQLAGGVAHDFNNLLAVILNYAAFVKEEVAAVTDSTEANSPDAERWQGVGSDLAQIELAAQKAARLTHQLLAFARREVARPEVVDLNGVITEIERLLHRTIGEHVRLVTNLGTDLHAILADPGQMEQILVNLAVNARDAMPGGGSLTIETSNLDVNEGYASTRPQVTPGPYVRLRVSDTGEGMPEAVRDRAFEPFFTTKSDGEGTGLGLATVYGIVRQTGGYAEIYSELGLGTTFTALLPATEQHTGPMRRGLEPAIARGGETVLVVEDEDALREVTRRILARKGYEVIVASDGKEAIDAVEAYPGVVDLLLTDVVMPHMLGKQVAEEIRARRPGLRVVFMSGFAQPVLGAQGTLEEGVVLVSKPFSESELLTKIRETLDASD